MQDVKHEYEGPRTHPSLTPVLDHSSSQSKWNWADQPASVLLV